jgi:hypothetical protein
MSKALAAANSGQSAIAFSDTIRGLVLERTAANKDKEGWQGIIYTKRGTEYLMCLLLNSLNSMSSM